MCIFNLYRPGFLKLGIKWQNVPLKPKESECLEFIKKRLTDVEYGIHSNYLKKGGGGDLAGGHEVLSESAGLILLHSVCRGDKAYFDKHFKIVKDKMMMNNYLLRWRISRDNPKLTECTASIDDLRVIRALVFAYDRWGGGEYKKYLVKMMNGVKKYETFEEGLVDYYDNASKDANKAITLCYLDLLTMGILAKVDKTWGKMGEKGLDVLKKGRISDTLPLYYKSYDYIKKEYSKDEKVNTIESFLSILHLCEIGHCPADAIAWMKRQIREEKAIFTDYEVKKGTPASIYESTASYGIAARIAKCIKDEPLYDMMIERMDNFQIRDNKSPLDGAFGYKPTQQVYSFDNLQALLAFQGWHFEHQ